MCLLLGDTLQNNTDDSGAPKLDADHAESNADVGTLDRGGELGGGADNAPGHGGEEERECSTTDESQQEQSNSITTAPLSVHARSLAIRIGSALNWHGIEKGGGGKKSKRRVVFTPNGPQPPPPSGVEAARALCVGFNLSLTGVALKDVVSKQRAARKARREKREANHVIRGKQRFVSGDEMGGRGRKVTTNATDSSSESDTSSSSSGDDEDSSNQLNSLENLLRHVTFVPGNDLKEEGVASSAGGRTHISARTEGTTPSALGEWETHTRGVGSRLLAKMGFTGGSLGKRGGVTPLPFENVEAGHGRKGIGFGLACEGSPAHKTVL